MLMLAFYARIQLAARISRLFFGASICMAAWGFFYYFELTASLDVRIWAMRLKFCFTLFLMDFYLRLTREITGRPKWLQGGPLWLLVTVPAVLAALMALTSPWHDGFRNHFRLASAPIGPLLVFDRGLFDMPVVVWFNLLSLMNIAVLVHASLTTEGLSRRKAILMVIALGIPAIFNALYFVGVHFVPGVNISLSQVPQFDSRTDYFRC